MGCVNSKTSDSKNDDGETEVDPPVMKFGAHDSMVYNKKQLEKQRENRDELSRAPSDRVEIIGSEAGSFKKPKTNTVEDKVET